MLEAVEKHIVLYYAMHLRKERVSLALDMGDGRVDYAIG